MKRLLLLSSLIPTCSFDQVYTTITDGDFYAPSSWDCTCVPMDGDTLVIDHAINMDAGVLFNSGSITISPGVSISDGGTGMDIYFNGGQLLNWGTLECRSVWIDSGYCENKNSLVLDSLRNDGTFVNNQSIYVARIHNDFNGNFFSEGSGGSYIEFTETLLNEGVFVLDPDAYMHQEKVPAQEMPQIVIHRQVTLCFR
jgi:hypothetical protein